MPVNPVTRKSNPTPESDTAQSTFGRIFNAARKAQGFHSQLQLDAFYAYMDHRAGCAECQKPGPGVALDDGYQPTMSECTEAKRLLAIEWKIADEDRTRG